MINGFLVYIYNLLTVYALNIYLGLKFLNFNCDEREKWKKKEDDFE